MMGYMWRWRRKYPILRERHRNGTRNNNPGMIPQIDYDEQGLPCFDKEMEEVEKLNLRVRGKSVINASR